MGAILIAMVQGVINRRKLKADAAKVDAETRKVEAELETELHKGDIAGLEGVIKASERVLQMAETMIKNLTVKVKAQEDRISDLEEAQLLTLKNMLDMQHGLAEREDTIRHLQMEKTDQQNEITRLQEANRSLETRVKAQTETIEHQATQIKELQREMQMIKAGKCA